MVVFGQGGCIRAKWLYSSKVVVFGQSGCIRVKMDVIWKSSFNQAKDIVCGQNEYIWAKVVAFGQSGCIRAKVVILG